MGDVSPETKTNIINSLAVSHGVAEATLEDEWGSWINDTQVPVHAGLSVQKVKQWFEKHLVSVGAIAGPSEDGRGIPDNSHKKDLGQELLGDPVVLETDAYDYSDCMDAGTELNNENRMIVRPRQTLANPQHSDRAFVQRILRRQHKRGTTFVSSSSFDDRTDRRNPSRSIPSEALPAISGDVFKEAEDMLMDTLMKQARDSQSNDSNEIDVNDDFDAAYAGDSVPKSEGALNSNIAPAGRKIPRKEMGSRRMRSSASDYALSKTIASFALRHRDSEPEASFFTGQWIGSGLALRIVNEDRRFSRVRKHPITNSDIVHRHSAIIHILIEGIVAAGRTSASADEYARATMGVLHEDIHNYARSVGTITGKFNGTMPAGGVIDKIRSFSKGAKRKGRALLNEAQKRVMIGRIVDLSNWAIGMPGETFVPGYGRDAFVKGLISKFGRSLQHTLTGSTKAGRVARNDGASYTTISLMQGTLKAFVEHPRMLPYLPTLFKAADDRLDQLNPQGYEEAEEAPYDTEISERELPPVPVDSKALAVTLVDKARAFLRRNESLAKRAGSRYVLMVPGDASCVAKVRATVTDATTYPGGADKYIKNGLLATHPNTELDKSGHLISMAGGVFHTVALASSRMRLKQLHRVSSGAQQDAHIHDDPWDRERKNIGGALQDLPNRLPMDCVVSNAPIDEPEGEGQHKMCVLYYWPRDQ